MDDREIIELFFARDENALREVSQKYGSCCKAVAQNILNDPEDAEECVNDTYMKAWETIPPQRPPVLRAYLARITRNLALNRIRFFKFQKRGGGEDALPFEELGDFISGEYSVEFEAERREFVEAINGFLEKLPEKPRLLFIGRYWGCLNLSELAARFGMSQNGVSQSLSRTVQKLKKYLVKRGFDL